MFTHYFNDYINRHIINKLKTNEFLLGKQLNMIVMRTSMKSFYVILKRKVSFINDSPL